MKTITSFDEEKLLWNKGYSYVIGIDEVGRGAFAGPVVAAAVVYPQFYFQNKDTPIKRSILVQVRDSKQLSPVIREKLDVEIRSSCLSFGIGIIEVPVINKIGIGKATFLAMAKAVASIMYHVESSKNINQQATKYILRDSYYLLVDGFKIPSALLSKNIEQKAIVKGDQKSLSIASASIIAKVYRDNLMRQLHTQYLEYGFLDNKGYGTLLHRNAIKKNGLSPIHRTSFNLSKFL